MTLYVLIICCIVVVVCLQRLARTNIEATAPTLFSDMVRSVCLSACMLYALWCFCLLALALCPAVVDTIFQ
jgi:hypothetical protein